MKKLFNKIVSRYKEIIERFKKLSFGKKVVFIISWLLLTLLIMFIIYLLLHFVKWVVFK